MRLMTTILPRRDGKVILRSRAGKVYEFAAEVVGGDLVCNVDDDDTVASALRTGDFEPVEAEDQAHAASLLMSLGGSDDEDGEGLDDEDDDGAADAPPEEAHTPPVAAAKPAAKRGGKRSS